MLKRKYIANFRKGTFGLEYATQEAAFNRNWILSDHTSDTQLLTVHNADQHLCCSGAGLRNQQCPGWPQCVVSLRSKGRLSGDERLLRCYQRAWNDRLQRA